VRHGKRRTGRSGLAKPAARVYAPSEMRTRPRRANPRLRRANLSAATALVATLDARDPFTAAHCAAVAVYARDIAAVLGLSEDEQQLAHLCGLVHDIGKIGLPPGLLEKPGALTLEERRLMQEHSAIGQRIVESSKVEEYAEIAKIVRHHHERIDGMGYPDGISGEAIPLLARVVAVAEAYHVMVVSQPYRAARSFDEACRELRENGDRHFDQTVVAPFVEVTLAKADAAYRAATRLWLASQGTWRTFHRSL
jgi:putative nucleotidyltransferase with HDIG domain